MSFDLRIESNDLSINPDGTIQTVRDNDKLIQDVIKAVLTTLGSNKFHKWYGNILSSAIIGQALDTIDVVAESQRAIQNTLSTIMALQNLQAKSQYVSPGETIAAIRDISVLRDDGDPRQFQITISVLTRKMTVAETTFTLRV